jgi:hypothetical protein
MLIHKKVQNTIGRLPMLIQKEVSKHKACRKSISGRPFFRMIKRTELCISSSLKLKSRIIFPLSESARGMKPPSDKFSAFQKTGFAHMLIRDPPVRPA